MLLSRNVLLFSDHVRQQEIRNLVLKGISSKYNIKQKQYWLVQLSVFFTYMLALNDLNLIISLQIFYYHIIIIVIYFIFILNMASYTRQ